MGFISKLEQPTDRWMGLGPALQGLSARKAAAEAAQQQGAPMQQPTAQMPAMAQPGMTQPMGSPMQPQIPSFGSMQGHRFDLNNWLGQLGGML